MHSAQDLKMNNEENTNVERGPISGCNFKQNPKITKIIVAASALAILIIGFSILALALRDKNDKSTNGKKFSNLGRVRCERDNYFQFSEDANF